MEECGQYTTDDAKKWYTCPTCHTKLFRMTPKTLIREMEIKCRRCKRIIEVNKG